MPECFRKTYSHKIRQYICCVLSKQILDMSFVYLTFLLPKNMVVVHKYSRKQNVMADSYSRRFNTNTEWMLDASVFNSLTISFFSPDVDLFASRLNKRMTPFVSWLPDPDALATNAFCLDWGIFLSYIFPPYCLINRILQKLSQDGAQAILVVPLWKTQTWYPKMLNMLVDFPLILPTTNDILSLPSSDREHPLSHNMTLLACHLSGNDCKT